MTSKKTISGCYWNDGSISPSQLRWLLWGTFSIIGAISYPKESVISNVVYDPTEVFYQRLLSMKTFPHPWISPTIKEFPKRGGICLSNCHGGPPLFAIVMILFGIDLTDMGIVFDDDASDLPIPVCSIAKIFSLHCSCMVSTPASVMWCSWLFSSSMNKFHIIWDGCSHWPTGDGRVRPVII